MCKFVHVNLCFAIAHSCNTHNIAATSSYNLNRCMCGVRVCACASKHASTRFTRFVAPFILCVSHSRNTLSAPMHPQIPLRARVLLNLDQHTFARNLAQHLHAHEHHERDVQHGMPEKLGDRRHLEEDEALQAPEEGAGRPRGQPCLRATTQRSRHM